MLNRLKHPTYLPLIFHTHFDCTMKLLRHSEFSSFNLNNIRYSATQTKCRSCNLNPQAKRYPFHLSLVRLKGLDLYNFGRTSRFMFRCSMIWKNPYIQQSNCLDFCSDRNRVPSIHRLSLQ